MTPLSGNVRLSGIALERHERGIHIVCGAKRPGQRVPEGGVWFGEGWFELGRREFGINGESSGKDGVITLGDHALVFSGLRRVTCGVAVHKAVDNRPDVRITGEILWTKVWTGKNLK
jgi:hypothetical protein